MNKPQVTFTTFHQFDVMGPFVRAKIGGVRGHHSLGDQNIVHTSRVERLMYESNGVGKIPTFVGFETQNTVYLIEQEDAHGEEQ